MINVMSDRIVTGRRNNQLVNLEHRIDSTMQQVKNFYDMSKSTEPTHEKTNLMWIIYGQSVHD